VLSATALIAGCGDQHEGSEPAHSAPASTPAASSTSACQADDFDVKESEGAGLGTTYDGLTLRNGSAASCVLRRTVRAQVIGPGHNIVLVSRPNPLGPRSITLAPGDAAEVTIGWNNWCKSHKGPFRARLLLPARGGRILSSRYGPAVCTGPASRPSKVAIAGFRRSDG
jgi:hypothetical protein